MKKLLVAFFALMMFAATANAQTDDASKAADKEARAKMKQKQNEDIDKALKEAGVADDVATKFKAVTQEFGTKSGEVRKNAALSEEEKATQLKAITDEKNAKLAEIIGAEKYKAFNKIRKAQKEADGSAKGN